MVKVYLNKTPFSAKENFVLYDWKDSKGEHYMRDGQGIIYFFIKDINPKKVLEDIFINPMRRFQFKSGIEPGYSLDGSVVNSPFKYLFSSFELPRTPEFNWSKYSFPIRRDTNLSALKESEIIKYLSKYIDN